ncbi:MAG: hypothetical protein JO129_04765 [Candidatus Dependentiae bacterium]|nr:hypothetical protein [Candidatus Dependentiae bacterium]
MKFYTIATVMLFSSSIIFCSQKPEYKIFEQVKEFPVYLNTSNNGEVAKIVRVHKMYLVEIPTYDSKTELELPSKKEWVWALAYQKIENIIQGKIDENTRYPILEKQYDENGMSPSPVYFRLSWVSAQRKNEIKERADKKKLEEQGKFQKAIKSFENLKSFKTIKTIRSIFESLSNKK